LRLALSSISHLRRVGSFAPASPNDLADALAFALRFDGPKRRHDAGAFMAKIVARRIVERLERADVVATRKPAGGWGERAWAGVIGRGELG
jgi:hypothetical protein